MKRIRPSWMFVIALLFLFAFWLEGTKWFGSTDQSPNGVINAGNYPSLQAALDVVPDSGGIVILPPGNHVLMKPLEVTRGNTRIQGSGPATHLINRNELGLPALILRAEDRSASNQEANGVRIWRTQLADFRISGNPKSGDGVLAIGINELYVHGLWLDHNGGHGICLADCYENPRITDCNITYNGAAGLHLKNKSWNPVIGSNHFEENRDGVEAIRIFNICMTGNSFDDQLRHGVIVEDGWGGALTGNVFEQCTGIGVVLDRNCYGMNIAANTFGQNLEGGLDLRDAWGCSVSANTFCINAKRALAIGPASGRIAVVGNNFCNAYIGPDAKPRDFPAAGLRLEGTADISVTGNVFAGLVEQAIQADDACKRIVISSNISTALPANRSEIDVPGVRELIKDLNLD